jgi:hypothetical protein
MTTARTDQYLTRRQAARRAGVTYNTIMLWERAGRLHPAAFGRGRHERFYIRVSELNAVINQEGPAFDPTLVWNQKELEPAPPPTEPDPHPERQPRVSQKFFDRLIGSS